jgi:hypothetical protein
VPSVALRAHPIPAILGSEDGPVLSQRLSQLHAEAGVETSIVHPFRQSQPQHHRLSHLQPPINRFYLSHRFTAPLQRRDVLPWVAHVSPAMSVQSGMCPRRYSVLKAEPHRAMAELGSAIFTPSPQEFYSVYHAPTDRSTRPVSPFSGVHHLSVGAGQTGWSMTEPGGLLSANGQLLTAKLLTLDKLTSWWHNHPGCGQGFLNTGA